MVFSWKTAISGGLTYCIGDSIAQFIVGDWLVGRMLGIFLIGTTLYALEIPNYFHWIEHRNPGPGLADALQRAILAAAYFNPLWIARHLALIMIFSGQWHQIDWGIFAISLQSFITCLPFTLLANYLIQNVIPLSWRFVSSATFSGLMAIYYALSEVIFA